MQPVNARYRKGRPVDAGHCVYVETCKDERERERERIAFAFYSNFKYYRPDKKEQKQIHSGQKPKH